MIDPARKVSTPFAACLGPRAYAALLCAAAATLAPVPGALAQEAAPTGKGRMADDMRAYFRGEKLEGPFFFGAGAAAVGTGAFLVTRDDEIARGAAFPLFGLGLVQMIVGAVVFLRTDAQVARLERQLQADPAAFKAEESKRIRGVNTQFVALMIVEAALMLGGAGMAAVAAKNDCCRTVQGVGLGIAGESASLLLLDLFAAARARDYADNLARFDPGASSAPPRPAPLGIGPGALGLRF
jgi:hypothetical protein